MANITLTNGYEYKVGDTNYTTRLVAIGNQEVWYENPAGTMVELAAANGVLAAGVPMAVIPAFQKVYIADGTVFKYIDFTATPVTWNTWTATAGTMPTSSNIGCLYRGRIVLNSLTDPFIWYMSRQGVPTDFLYAQNDAQSAVAGSDAPVGQIGDIITSLVPCQDDYMFIGCAHSVWIMRGDPAAGGSLDVLTNTDGIFGPYSYCFDGNGNMYYMGTGGLYKILKGGSTPEPMTASRLPKLLDGIARDTHRITMGFDRTRHGLIISLFTFADNTSTQYWYDLRTDGFFPETYNVGISCQSFYDADSAAYSQLLMGSTDGYIRYFDSDSKSDEAANGDDVAISSYALLGPVEIGGGSQGLVNDLQLTTGSGSTDTDSMNYSVFTGNSVQECADKVKDGTTPLHTGSVTGVGRQKNIRSRARGAALAVKISNSTVEKSWAIEKIEANMLPAGRLKL